jgi:hypothetical protein
MNQLTIDYSKRLENNLESQSILEANKDRINKQCRLVLDLLQVGYRLTVRDALIFWGIGDLRRRVKDLKDMHGIDIKTETQKGGFKTYFL